MALPVCTITGTLYKPDGTVAAGERLRIVKCVVSGQLVTSYLATTNASDVNGVITFDAPRGAQIWVYGNVVDFDINNKQGVRMQVPDAASATLSALAPGSILATQVPIATPGGGFQFTQASPATTWTITHNLNTRPVAVQLFDTNNKKIEGEVVETSVNVVTVNFNVAQAGSARII